LRDTTKNLDDRGTAIAGLPEECACEQIKDCTTLPAAVVGNDGSSPPVRRLIGAKWMTLRTAQAIWMQTKQQEVIASLFIEQSIERKSQHRLASFTTVLSEPVAARGGPRSCFTIQPT
jgi:hypothetical protein